MINSLTFISKSATHTKYLGKMLGRNLLTNSCIALSGELGSGKTCLVQGIVTGLGADEKSVASPTYTLVNQYKTTQGIVYHCDLYRLNSSEQVHELGLEENLDAGIVLIEWPELILSDLSHIGYIHTCLKGLTETERQIDLTAYGDIHKEILNNVYRQDTSSFNPVY